VLLQLSTISKTSVEQPTELECSLQYHSRAVMFNAVSLAALPTSFATHFPPAVQSCHQPTGTVFPKLLATHYQHRLTQTHSWVVVGRFSVKRLALSVGWERIAGHHRSPNSLILRIDRASTVDYNFQNICTTTNQAGMFSAVSLVSCDVQCSITRGITNIFCNPLPNWSPNLVINLPVFPNLLVTHQFTHIDWLRLTHESS
jgi:hypothetical protein